MSNGFKVVIMFFSSLFLNTSIGKPMHIDNAANFFSCEFYIENRDKRGVILAHHFWLDGYIAAFDQLVSGDRILDTKSIDELVTIIDDQCKERNDDTFPNVVIDVINNLLVEK